MSTFTPTIYAHPLPDPARITNAIDNAENLFWMAIAEEFSEIKHGDETPDGKMARVAHNRAYVSNYVSDNWPRVELEVGMRVYFPHGTNAHFTTIGEIECGETGTVVEAHPQIVRVKLDKHHPGGEEWDNCYTWCDDEVDEELAGDILPLPTQRMTFVVEVPMVNGTMIASPSDIIERIEEEEGVRVLVTGESIQPQHQEV